MNRRVGGQTNRRTDKHGPINSAGDPELGYRYMPYGPLQWSKGKGFLEVFTKYNYYFCVIYFRVFSKTSKLDKILNNY